VQAKACLSRAACLVSPEHSLRPTNTTLHNRWAGVRPANIASAWQHISLCRTKVQRHDASLSDFHQHSIQNKLVTFYLKIIINYLSLGQFNSILIQKNLSNLFFLLVLQENLRQLCVFQLANESGQSYRWWEYVTKFGEECTMSGNNYNENCAERVCQFCYAFDSPKLVLIVNVVTTVVQ